MKNNTKIRLRLSKQLFESLAKQVLAEAKGDMSGGAYTEAVKAPKGEKKHKAEKTEESKPLKKEMETKVAEEEKGEEKTVKITLDEYMESGDWSYQLGKWAVENMPKIADAIKSASTSGDPGQQLVDLGNAIAGLAVGGAATIGAGLAIAKDDIKKVAQKVKGMLGGKKDAVAEGKDEDLAAIVAKIPSDFEKLAEGYKKIEKRNIFDKPQMQSNYVAGRINNTSKQDKEYSDSVRKEMFAVERPNGQVVKYFDSEKEAQGWISKNDPDGIVDYNVRKV